jgi:hypothetical protein
MMIVRSTNGISYKPWGSHSNVNTADFHIVPSFSVVDGTNILEATSIFNVVPQTKKSGSPRMLVHIYQGKSHITDECIINSYFLW